MSDPLSRDALLRCLREDTPANIRTLARLNDDADEYALLDHVDVVDQVLATQPSRVSIPALHDALYYAMGEATYLPTLWESYQTFCAMSWWLMCANTRPPRHTKTWRSARITDTTNVRANLIVDGDLELASTSMSPCLIVWGDLFVSGDVTGHGVVLVAGSIEVEGSWRTEDMNITLLVTGRDVRVGRVFESCTSVFVGGGLEAPLINLTSPTRTNRLMGGACAIVFDDHDGMSWSPEPPDASLVWSPHMAIAPPELAASIRGTLHPDRLEPFGELDTSDEMFWDAVWDDLFHLGLGLELLFTPHALEVFRNRSRGLKMAHR